MPPWEPTTIVVTGVSGVGKSSVARALAGQIGATMAEGDDFHSAANVAQMRSGQPLDDQDRWPWLRGIAAWIGEQERAGRSSVVACSALRRSYRDLLRTGHPSVRFCELHAEPATLRARLERRRGHYMTATLLNSQLQELEPLGADEPGVRVDCTDDLDTVVRNARAALGLEPGR